MEKPQVVATGVSIDDFLRGYDATHHEWIDGTAMSMAPITVSHNRITTYLSEMLRSYFSLSEVAGEVLHDPVVLFLGEQNIFRSPDLQLLIGENTSRVRENFVEGPADICIEVVSPGSVGTDYGYKLLEYEAGGVREYWLIDPQRKQARFHRLTDENLYADVPPTDDHYTTPLLPGFTLRVPTLWDDSLPDFAAVYRAVTAMLNTDTSS